MGILLIPPLILGLNGILFKPWAFGEVGMWWEFPRYLIYFLFGFLMISASKEYFQIIDKIRIPVTVITPILSILWYIFSEGSSIPQVMEGGWIHNGHSAFSIEATIATLIQAFHSWFWCLLIFSWASKLLNRPSRWIFYLNEAVYPTYIVHMHLTFLPIAIFGIFGLNYYIGLTIGTIFVLFGVMFCFEIIRRTTFARIFYGIKGGHSEVELLFPYNQVESRRGRLLIAFLFHIIAIGMTLGLLILLVSAGILSNI